jgi:hypothetical protein
MKESLFAIAEKQLQKEKVKYTLADVLDRAIVIRKQLDNREDLMERVCQKAQHYWDIYRR